MAAMAHDLRADIDELFALPRQGLLVHGIGQREQRIKQPRPFSYVSSSSGNASTRSLRQMRTIRMRSGSRR